MHSGSRARGIHVNLDSQPGFDDKALAEPEPVRAELWGEAELAADAARRSVHLRQNLSLRLRQWSRYLRDTIVSGRPAPEAAADICDNISV